MMLVCLMGSVPEHKKAPPTPALPVLPPEGEVARRVEGGLALPPQPVFPTKAGIQTLTHRRIVRGASSSFDGARMRMNGSCVDEAPSPNRLPLKGKRAFLYRRHCERSEATQGTDADLW